jgi:hypothetical protein
MFWKWNEESLNYRTCSILLIEIFRWFLGIFIGFWFQLKIWEWIIVFCTVSERFCTPRLQMLNICTVFSDNSKGIHVFLDVQYPAVLSRTEQVWNRTVLYWFSNNWTEIIINYSIALSHCVLNFLTEHF